MYVLKCLGFIIFCAAILQGIETWLGYSEWVTFAFCLFVGWNADTAVKKWLPSLFIYAKIKLNNWAIK